MSLSGWPFELWIGLRYTRAKRRNHFISFISVVSMAGIALGVMALIVVMSVMNGFQDELRNRILGVAAHIEMSGHDGRLENWPELDGRVRQQAGIIGSAPYINGQGLLAAGGETRGVMLRGVLPDREGQVDEVPSRMKSGRLEDLRPGEFNIVLGAELARALGAFRGDRLTLVVPQGVVTPAGMIPRMKQFTVVGVFEAGMYEYDAGLAFLHIDDAAKLLRTGEAVSGLRLKLADMDEAPRVRRALVNALNSEYAVSDWTQSHANFFRAVQIEKRMMFIILSLIVAVAAFNIVSTLVMAVQDKQSDIAILRTLGMQPGSVMQVFMVQGSLIGVIGMLMGVSTGILLALNIETVVPFIEGLLGQDLFPADVYYISELPSKLVLGDVLWVGGISLLLSFLATLYPSWRASRVHPAEALRYE
ncbi:MAG: lipoprotein-releasing ABC transporter permease subunit [Betaproteobacteria bacterium]|nr:lipoprotein-releasing ABC transporter permease subunit [Betaproteobacteria bacterium]